MWSWLKRLSALDLLECCNKTQLLLIITHDAVQRCDIWLGSAWWARFRHLLASGICLHPAYRPSWAAQCFSYISCRSRYPPNRHKAGGFRGYRRNTRAPSWVRPDSPSAPVAQGEGPSRWQHDAWTWWWGAGHGSRASCMACGPSTAAPVFLTAALGDRAGGCRTPRRVPGAGGGAHHRQLQR